MPPGRSFAGEQPLSKQRLEDPEGGAGSAIGLRVIHQNMADCFGGVEQNRGAAEEAADDDLLLIGPLRPDPKVVGAHQRGELTRREVLRGRIRMRRDEGPNALRRDGGLHRLCLARSAPEAEMPGEH